MPTIVFDLDDTLYDRAQPSVNAFLNFNPAKGLSFERFHEIYTKNSNFGFEQFQNQNWTLAESHIFRIKETLREMGVEISRAQATAFQASYETFQRNIVPYPSIIEILDFLQEKDVQTLIITNGPSPHQRNKINYLGLSSYFKPNQIIVSGEEGIAKPDRRIFEIAEKRFHLDKNKTWYIGDSHFHDIKGAANAGWHSIWFNNNKHDNSPSPLPNKTVYSILELKEYIFELVKGE